MSNLRVKSITIENMHNVSKKTYSFHEGLNYIQGANAIGKSTILQAIQLALLGYIPGTAKQNKAIFAHGNAHHMFVSVVLENSDTKESITISRSWTQMKGSIVSDLQTIPEGLDISSIFSSLELPIFNFNDFVNMTSNQLKDWFISFLPKSQKEINWEQELKECCVTNHIIIPDEEMITESVKQVDPSASGTEQIRKMNDWFKSAVSFKKQELQRLQGTIQSLVFYDDCDTSQDAATVEQSISDTTNAIAETKDLLRIRKRNEEIQKNLSQLNLPLDIAMQDTDEYKDLKAKLDTAEASLEELKEKEQEYNQRLSDIKSEMTSMSKVLSGNGTCPYLGNACETIGTLMTKYQAEQVKLQSERSEVDASMNSVWASIREQQDVINKVRSEIKTLNQKFFQRDALMMNFTELPAMPLTILEAEAQIQSMEEHLRSQNSLLAKLRANEKYNEMIDTLTSQKFVMEQEMEVYKAWVNLTGVNGMQSSDDAIAPFIILTDQITSKLRMFFLDNVSAKFNLESTANSFSFGIERDGSYIPYDLLSSGEKCMYALAMMMCLTEVSQNSCKLIMIDDLLDHLDSANVDKLFTSLLTVKDIQLVFAGVKETSVKDVDNFRIAV